MPMQLEMIVALKMPQGLSPGTEIYVHAARAEHGKGDVHVRADGDERDVGDERGLGDAAAGAARERALRGTCDDVSLRSIDA